MKRFLFLLLAIASIVFVGCSDSNDEPEEKKIKASVESVQGTWNATHYDEFFHVTFTNDNYSFYIMDMTSNRITHREYGTFFIDEYKIKTQTNKKSRLDDADIYFTDETEMTLYLSIAGYYMKGE